MSNEQQQVKLKELENNVRISGILKEVNLEIKPNKKEPNIKQIMGNIVVMVEDPTKKVVNEHEINLFAKESSKLFKGYVTVMNEYKAADVVGKENADLVTVQGSLDENKYLGSDGIVKQFNRIRGLFVNRVEALEKHEALAQMEVVVQGITPNEIIVDGVPQQNGELKLNVLTVGYNNTVNKIHDIIVPTNLANTIQQAYMQGSTGKLTFEIQNYVELVETKPDPLAEQGGFGMQVDLGGAVKKYNRKLLVVGGFPPYYDERAMSEDDIRFMNQIRNLEIDNIKNTVPATPQVNTGVGGFGINNPDPFAAGNNGPINISEDDLPF